MERDNRDLYFHGGLGEENRRNYGPADRDREDYGRAYDHRDRDHTFDSDRFRNYQRRDYDMENRYYENMRGNQDNLSDIRQRYGVSSYKGSGYGYDSDRNGNWQQQRRHSQQGYGSGRMGGYSGSAFGGANYSAHGDFGGSPEYGNMSGGGGNLNDDASSSGYGSGYQEDDNAGNYNTYRGQSIHPNYSGSYDRGGYRNYDPNNRWR
ncbi:hypothetical protein I2I11_14185 [Pontibacter sp. 172403-2]|uniref:hypothetical protein n=1 Tax=Pontibacter rufus TaxID=2791028 RepID=UPI0018AFFE47|nr:hypothetical protein [Pontibacter sp. 172403-2]MBF9254449.1 hypothetical protein [Pontibacter sp. 172403-2]